MGYRGKHRPQSHLPRLTTAGRIGATLSLSLLVAALLGGSHQDGTSFAVGDRNPDRASRASLRLPVAPSAKQEVAESVLVKQQAAAAKVAAERKAEADRVAAAKAAAAAKAKAAALAKKRAAEAKAKAAKEKAAKARAARAAAAASAAAKAKAKAREQAAQRAAKAAASLANSSSATVAEYREYAQEQAAKRGWGPTEFGCLDAIWTQESQWRTDADNPTSDAYGIPQALPGSKMASAGPDWATNYKTQIDWGLGYIDGRYGTPCKAWAFKVKSNYY